MGNKRYIAWRFIHPDIEAQEEFAGLSIASTGGIEMVDGRDSVRQSILLLLSTIPGERIMRPDYGCDLYRLVFAPNDATTAGLAIHYVRQAIERWEHRINIVKLDAFPNESDQSFLEIFLEYRLRVTQTLDNLSFSINLLAEEN